MKEKTLKEKFQKMLDAKALTYSQVARMINIDLSTLFKQISGQHKPIPKNMEALCKLGKGYFDEKDFN